MQHKPVRDALQAHFDLDARCVEFISRFLIALLKVRSVNLDLLSHFCPVVRPLPEVTEPSRDFRHLRPRTSSSDIVSAN
jgi:hypothetical protein